MKTNLSSARHQNPLESFVTCLNAHEIPDFSSPPQTPHTQRNPQAQSLHSQTPTIECASTLNRSSTFHFNRIRKQTPHIRQPSLNQLNATTNRTKSTCIWTVKSTSKPPSSAIFARWPELSKARINASHEEQKFYLKLFAQYSSSSSWETEAPRVEKLFPEPFGDWLRDGVAIPPTSRRTEDDWASVSNNNR